MHGNPHYIALAITYNYISYLLVNSFSCNVNILAIAIDSVNFYIIASNMHKTAMQLFTHTL